MVRSYSTVAADNAAPGTNSARPPNNAATEFHEFYEHPAIGVLRTVRSFHYLLQSACRRFLHDFNNRVLHFLRHLFQLRRVEHRQQRGWLQSQPEWFYRPPRKWRSGMAVRWRRSCFRREHLLRLLRLTDLEYQTFVGELYALLRHGLFQVVNLHDAKVIVIDGGLQGKP